MGGPVVATLFRAVFAMFGQCHGGGAIPQFRRGNLVLVFVDVVEVIRLAVAADPGT